MLMEKGFSAVSILVCVVFFSIIYWFSSGASLSDSRAARRMMRADMEVIMREPVKILHYGDDKKTKTVGARIYISIDAIAWSPIQKRRYEQVLESIGWYRSEASSDGDFFCKRGVSATVSKAGEDLNAEGYISMSFPSDPRAGCHRFR